MPDFSSDLNVRFGFESDSDLGSRLDVGFARDFESVLLSLLGPDLEPGLSFFMVVIFGKFAKVYF